jgi:nitrogen fixation NifU-like protein
MTDLLRDASPATLAAMYQETLLAHHRAPHNRRAMPDATAVGARKNPLCGDALFVAVRLDDGLVADAAFTGRGCSIAVASASMLTDVLPGLSRHDALALIHAVETMLAGSVTVIALPEALAALRGVAPFPGRHGCASMPWLALRDALTARP